MRNKYIQHFEDAQIAGKEIPQFKAGDTLRVGIRISEGDKTRIQNLKAFVLPCVVLAPEELSPLEKLAQIMSAWREFSQFTLESIR